MAMRYGYFDSEITGYDSEGMPIFDRAETSELLCLIFANLISNGVLAKPGTCFQVLAKEALTIEVQPGFGVIKGHFGYNNEVYPITLSKAPTAYKRIDIVVLRLNSLDRTVEIVVKEGEAAATPVAPALLQPTSGDYYELCLAEILISSNQTVITQSNITDTRADSSKCGYITQLIEHLDTSVFYEQLNQFYDEFTERSNLSYEQFMTEMDTYLSNLKISGQNQVQDIVDTLNEFEQQSEDEFDAWFQHVKDKLSEDVAGMLQNQIDDLTREVFLRYYGIMNQETEFMPDGSIVQTNNEATVTTVKGINAEGLKTITQTLVPVSEVVGTITKVTTIHPATATTNKIIKEVFTSE